MPIANQIFSNSADRQLGAFQWRLICTVAIVIGSLPMICPAQESGGPSSTPVRARTSTPEQVQLQPPANAEPQLRIARRPWFLEKLTGPKKEPSVKMNPPRPPAQIPDPPSTARMIPDDVDVWVPRGSVRPNDPGTSANQPAVTESGDAAPLGNDSSTVEPHSHPNSLRPEAAAASGAEDRPEETLDAPSYAQDVHEPIVIETANPLGEQTASAPKVDQDDSADETAQHEIHETSNGAIVEIATPADLSDEPVSETPPSDAPADSASQEATASNPVADDKHAAPTSSPPSSKEVVDQDSGTDATPGSDKSGKGDQLDATADLDLDYAGFPRQPIKLTTTVRRMYRPLQSCLRYYHSRPENANERSNWGMMHAIMVYGANTRLIANRRYYNSIAWIAGNNACRGQRLLIEQDGRITARLGVGLQGHQAQLLAILAICDVPIDYPLYANDHQYTVGDLVESEMLACKSGEELTFTLIGLAHYMDTDSVWRNADGEVWDFSRLIREELAQPIIGAACGGTHRLMGFGHALRKRRSEGKPIQGQWTRAEVYTSDFVQYAYRLQNRDGSMTTDWFEGREDNGDMDRKIQTTGHIVEWLLTITPDAQLQDRRLVSAVRYLLNTMSGERDHEWRIGPKGHALRSLAMFYERVYQNGPAWQTRSVAESSSRSRR